MQISGFNAYARQRPNVGRKQPASAPPLFGMSVAMGGEHFLPNITTCFVEVPKTEKWIRRNTQTLQSIISFLNEASIEFLNKGSLKPLAPDDLPNTLKKKAQQSPQEYRGLRIKDMPALIGVYNAERCILFLKSPQGWVEFRYQKSDGLKPEVTIRPMSLEAAYYATKDNLCSALTEQPPEGMFIDRETHLAAEEMGNLIRQLFGKAGCFKQNFS